MRPLSGFSALALAALTLVACGDPEGPTYSTPDRGLQGAWVRTRDPGPPNPAAIQGPLPADTLYVYEDLGGLWSREFLVENGGQFSKIRRCTRVRFATERPRVLVTLLGDPMVAGDTECPAIEALRPTGDLAAIAPPPAPRRLSMVPGPHYEILREGRDLLRVRTVGGEFVSTEWYRRAVWPPVD